MGGDEARIIVGTSTVAGNRRHAYLLFQQSDGSLIVVRGGPDARAQGDDLADFAGATLFGVRNYGSIIVESAPYVPPYLVASQRQLDGSILDIPFEQADPNDPYLLQDAQGRPEARWVVAPDWPLQGEHHERLVVWRGADDELAQKLSAARIAGWQINAAQLEYSPLYNNSNGVASTLLIAADVVPSLPLDKDGDTVNAPNFGSNLHQNVGLMSDRSGYWFDGKEWYDGNDHRIQPPQAGAPTTPLEPLEHQRSGSGSLDISLNGTLEGPRTLNTGDPELDRLAVALLADDDAAVSQASRLIAESPDVRRLEDWGREVLAIQEREELQQPDGVRHQARAMQM